MVQSVTFVVQGKKITAERKIVEVSEYIRKLLQNLVDNDSDSDSDDEDGNKETSIEIPIDNISPETFDSILSWCSHYYDTHKDAINAHENTKIKSSDKSATLGDWTENESDKYQTDISDVIVDEWERKFLEVDGKTLNEIILAANFLDIRPLFDATCKLIAESFRGSSPSDILNAFGLLNEKDTE